MNRTLLPAAALAIVLASAGGGMATGRTIPTFKGHALAGRARISLADARAIALKARPGAFTDQELEKEAGGSGLRYSFDIKAAGHVYEVGVDAADGRVLENDAEGAHPD
ncbi:MAG TPA: PepSY domain-containing protein [Caulobacteraceae bacterium]